MMNVGLCEFYEPTGQSSCVDFALCLNLDTVTNIPYYEVSSSSESIDNLVCSSRNEIILITNKTKIYSSMYLYGYAQTSGKCKVVIELTDQYGNTNSVIKVFNVVAGRANALYSNFPNTYAVSVRSYVYTNCNFIPKEVIVNSIDGGAI